MTRLGHFSIILATDFLTKVAQRFGDFWGAILKSGTLGETTLATFWITFGKIGYFKFWSHWSRLRWHRDKRSNRPSSFLQNIVYCKPLGSQKEASIGQFLEKKSDGVVVFSYVKLI